MKKIAFLILASLTSMSALAHKVTFYNASSYDVKVQVKFPSGKYKEVSINPSKDKTIEWDEAIDGVGTFKPDSLVTVKYDMSQLGACFPDGKVQFATGSSNPAHEWTKTYCKKN
jgi:hypothetical protein